MSYGRFKDLGYIGGHFGFYKNANGRNFAHPLKNVTLGHYEAISIAKKSLYNISTLCDICLLFLLTISKRTHFIFYLYFFPLLQHDIFVPDAELEAELETNMRCVVNAENQGDLSRYLSKHAKGCVVMNQGMETVPCTDGIYFINILSVHSLRM